MTNAPVVTRSAFQPTSGHQSTGKTMRDGRESDGRIMMDETELAVLLNPDSEDAAALTDAITMTADATSYSEGAVTDAAEQLAMCGFDADEICVLLHPVATFADEMCEPLVKTADAIAEQIHIFGVNPADVTDDILTPFWRAVFTHPVTADDLYTTLHQFPPAVAAADSHTFESVIEHLAAVVAESGGLASKDSSTIRRQILRDYGYADGEY